VSSDDFVHLHVHTHYSLLDGASRVPELVGEVKAKGQSAVAMTDHGTMGGAYEFYHECLKQGVKPIIGMEAYYAPSSREEKAVFWGTPDQRKQDVSGSGAYTHLTLLARDAGGLRNLYRLHHLSYTEGFYRKPRVDFDLLSRYGGGLIVLSGCMGGPVATRLRLGQTDEAEATAMAMARDLHLDGFYIEVMDHEFQEERDVTDALISLALRLDLPMVATNDTHYTTPSDDVAQKALLHLQTYGAFAGFSGTGYHIKGRGDMAALHLPASSLATPNKIALEVEDYADVFKGKRRIPISKGFMSEDFDAQVMSGLAQRMYEKTKSNNIPLEYMERAEYENETIVSLGFETYFQTLAEIVQEAKRRGIRVGPGRGSAGGSLVAFALRITDLDPIVHGLLFERFLNPQRVSVPDIDIDIEDSRRDELREWVLDTYGEEYVCMIGTYGTIAAKRALSDSAKVLGKSFATGENMKKLLPPPKFGRAPSLADGDWSELSDSEKEVLELAKKLEGTIRGHGQHAAGLIISPEALPSILPLRKAAGGKENTETSAWRGLVTAFPMGPVDVLGLTKYDFLGLRNLDIITKTMEFIGREIPLPVDPEKCNDSRTYELLRRGETLGVFQLDGGGMQRLLRDVRPTAFGDISAVLALYRPGPMGAGSHHEYAKRKNRKLDSSPVLPELEDILAETYGLIVYQEQVLAALNRVCGWSYAEAELVFNAMRKKDHAKLDAARPSYVAAAEANGYAPEAIDLLWETLIPFADYSFNKAHTAGYGLVAYWTAYLKANHPNEYLAALLSSVSDNPEKLQEYLAECERMRIRLLPPDVNTSGGGFTPVPEGIRYGLSAIKGVGEKATEALCKRRPYKSLDDFFRRVDPKALNAGIAKALAKSGTLDTLHPDRAALLEDAERLTELASRERGNRGDNLFGYSYQPRPVAPVGLDTIREWELDTLGVTLVKPLVSIAVDKPLTPTQWVYMSATLKNSGADIEYVLKYKSQVVHRGVCTLSESARQTLRDVGAVVK
jgi:DNA polymerase III subunit alpha